MARAPLSSWSSLLKLDESIYRNQAGIQNSYRFSLTDHSSAGVCIQKDDSSKEAGLPIYRAVITNACLGAGLLAFPRAYSNSGGILQALAIQGVSFILSGLLILRLSQSGINKLRYT